MYSFKFLFHVVNSHSPKARNLCKFKIHREATTPDLKTKHQEMDHNLQSHETQETKSSSTEELAIVVSQAPFATTSLSMSLSTVLPTQFFTQQKISSLFTQAPSKVKIPTQAASLSHLSLSSMSPTPTKLSSKSTISSNPLYTTLSLGPRRPSDPSNAAGIRRAAIVWFRNDLRVHDNECLNSANNEAMSVLPVYCFDPKEYGKSSSGFDKAGPFRASFMIESVSDLRKSLQARGSDLVVRVGKPETVLAELAKAIGADAVYAHRDVSHGEVEAEEKIEAAMKDEGVEVKYFWGSTLYHVDDLPFNLEDMPSNYGEFRERVQRLEVRKTIAALDQLKGLPSRGDVEPGDIPSLMDLGLNRPEDGQVAANASSVGGETEALRRVQKFAAECQTEKPKGNNGSNDSIYGANFSSKISQWLTTGCVSPRFMLDELKKTASGSPDGGMNWLMSELSWRDFFRFITKKYSTPKKQTEAVPATAAALA